MQARQWVVQAAWCHQSLPALTQKPALRPAPCHLPPGPCCCLQLTGAAAHPALSGWAPSLAAACQRGDAGHLADRLSHVQVVNVLGTDLNAGVEISVRCFAVWQLLEERSRGVERKPLVLTDNLSQEEAVLE